MFYSHYLFYLSYNKVLRKQDKVYDAREGQCNFPVCLSILTGRIMKTKYQILRAVGPKFGLILVVGTICESDNSICGLGSGFEATPRPWPSS